MKKSRQVSADTATATKSKRIISGVLKQPSATTATSMANTTEEELRVDLISRVLATGDITQEELHQNDCTLNSIQMINFANFYFDEPSPPPWLLAPETVVHDMQPISACFPCIACSYRFSFEHTFHQHLDRRSLLIRLYCMRCNTYKTFFNKCKLFYHVMSHKSQLLEPIYTSIQLEPMPIDRATHYMFQHGVGSSAHPADNMKMTMSQHYLDLDALLIDFDALVDEWDLTTSSTAQTTAAFHLSNRILNNRKFKMSDQDVQELKSFIRKLIVNRFLVFRCGVCDALFFDTRELRAHYTKSQANEFQAASLLPVDVLETLSKSSSESLSLEEEQIVGQQKKMHLKSLIAKYVPFEQSAYVRNNEMMNAMSFKRLQYTTRCYTLALLNTFTSSFKLYKSAEEETIVTGTTANQPLICPECGLSFDSRTREGHNRFRLHLIHECLYTLKHQVHELRCPIRGCLFSTDSEQQFVAHYSQLHLVKRFECNLCLARGGIKYAFNNAKNYNVADTNIAPDGPVTLQNLLRHVVNVREHQVNRATSNENKVINEALVAHINQHHAEVHARLFSAPQLRLIYKCMCRRRHQKIAPSSGVDTITIEEIDDNDEPEIDECVHSEWKSCRAHILTASAQPIYSIKCMKCASIIVHRDFKSIMHDFSEHMRNHRQIDQESYFLCPICGIIRKDRDLNEHIIKYHSQLNLNKYPSSCFYNLVTTLLDLSTDKADKSQLHPNNPKLFSFRYLADNFPKDFYIFFCLNCHLFFASPKCTLLSHNCYIRNECAPAPTNSGIRSRSVDTQQLSSSADTPQLPPQPLPQETVDDKSVSNGGGSGLRSNSAGSMVVNYFSPIYLKFNVRQLFDKTQSAGVRPETSLQQQASTDANDNDIDMNAIQPTTSGLAPSMKSTSSNSNDAYSSKRMRVDSIIEKLKP